LLSTPTEDIFREVYPQSVADFVLGCQRNVISVPGREKFGELFGVDPTQSDGNECPTTCMDVFREQALWGERRMAFAVTACSNRIEDMQGRLNQDRQQKRNPQAKCGSTGWSSTIEI
jgi:hypothetical protein